MADPRAKRKGALIPREQAPTIDARYLVNGVSRHDLSSGAASVAWAAVTGKPSVNTTSPLSGGGSLASSLTLTTSMATSRLIGRTTAGTGVMEQLTVTAPLALGTGTLTTTMATARLLGRYSAGTGVMQEITIGSGLSLSGAGALSATGATVADGDYGDIVVSGAGTSWLLDSTIAGTAGGRTIYGGNAANDDLHLYSTSHATKGYVYIYDDLVIGNAGTEAGGVSINGTNYEAIAGVHDIGGARAASLHLHRHSTTLQNYLLATRSATEDDTHAALTNADVILTLMAAACTGTHYDQSASIEFLVGAGTVSGTSSPGRIRFRTTPDGSQTPTTRLDILANGQINTSDGLDVGGTLTAQTGTSTTAGLLKLGIAAGAAPYERIFGYACDDLPTILASSANTHFERAPEVPTVLQLLPKPLATTADASASPPSGWTVANTARISSASVASGRLACTCTGTGEYYNGTATAAYWYHQDLLPDGSGYECVFRLDASSIGTNSSVRMVWTSQTAASTATIWFSVDIRYTGVAYTVAILYNGTTGATLATLDLATFTAGVWFRVRLQSTIVWRIDYNSTAGGTTAPTTWTTGAAYVTNGYATGVFTRVIAFTTPGGNACVGGFICASERLFHGSGWAGVWGGGGYATTSDTLTLIASAGNAVERWTPNITKLRLALADALNRLPGDAATATWSCTGSDSDTTPDVAPTMQAAASLDLKQDGSDTAADAAGYKYWALHVAFASASGVPSGSLETALIRLVPA